MSKQYTALTYIYETLFSEVSDRSTQVAWHIAEQSLSLYSLGKRWGPGHPKYIIIEKQEKKKQLSGYKRCHTYKNQSLEAGSTLHFCHMQ